MQRPFILDSWMRLRALWLALVLSATMVHAAGFVVPDLPLITTDGTLYRVTLWRDGDPAKSTVITGALNDLDASGKAVHPQGRVTVAVTPVTPTETRWSISVDPAEGYGVYEVAFPLLVLKPVPGGKPEHLALPRGYGALMEDV
ncbi:MAG: hypothetical protein KAI66_14455, partial [Lentisphaeria bacterium]|nr:hypothetical protein [Lentisphaeria bacterium]